MDASNKEARSELAQAALALDDEFAQLKRLSGEIDRVDIENDNGLERVRLLLARFSETGQRIGDGVQVLAKALDDARGQAEAAAQLVSVRAEQVQKRQELSNRLLERFHALGLAAGKISSMVISLQKSRGGDLTEEERQLMISQLPELNSKLGLLVDEGVLLKKDALSANMKKLAGEADSVSQSLQAARQRLNSALSEGF